MNRYLKSGGIHMNWEKAYQIYEHSKTLYDLYDIKKDITEIDQILAMPVLNVYSARQKIGSINEKHPEIIFIHALLYRLKNPYAPNTPPESVDSASDSGLRSDLSWKRDYLTAKGKTTCLDELYEYLKKKYNL